MPAQRNSYDATSRESILAYARKLLGKSLHALYPALEDTFSGKGGMGQCVEKIHFGYECNSKSEPDFGRAGLELKCTPIKENKDSSMTAKERLVLNVIDYTKEATKTFWTSSFMVKNHDLLLMFYLHKYGTAKLDLLFKIIRIWNIPEEDLKIFIDDWRRIHDKIANGRAHEISEGDTLYLAACPKGSKSGGRNAPAAHDGNKGAAEGLFDKSVLRELHNTGVAVASRNAFRGGDKPPKTGKH